MLRSIGSAIVLSCAAACTSAWCADGALDTTFGGGTGKVMLAQAGGYQGSWQATDVAVQSNGKIVISGWTDEGLTDCFVLRLNTDGSLDSTFGGGNGFAAGYAGYGNCKYTGVVVLADDSIVASGYGVGYAATPGFVARFTPNGTPDLAYGFNGSFDVLPASGDVGIELMRLVADGSGNTYSTGYYAKAGGNDDFYVARIAADGSSLSQVTYALPFTTNYSDIAYDIAAAADGTYYVAGTATSASGDLDCAIAHFQYAGGAMQVDATFSGSPAITIAKNYGGNDNDYCLAAAVQPPFGTLVLGGQSTAVLGATNWQIATATSQGPSGLSNSRTDSAFWYDQTTNPGSGQIDAVNRVVVEPYDNRALFVGSGPNHASSPSTGYDFGVLRQSSAGMPDTSFGPNGNGYALYDVGSTIAFANSNHASSAVFWHGRLIIVGSAQDATAGTHIAVIRLAPFDGIFRNGFDPAIVLS